MKKIYLLTFIAIVCVSNNSSVYSCSNDYKSRNASYNYDGNQCNVVTSSDLDDVDTFINNFLLGNTIPTANYYVPPYRSFVNNMSNNNACNRTFSYDIKDNNCNIPNYQTNTYNKKQNNRQITLSNNSRFNNSRLNRGIVRNNTCKVLQGTKKQCNNIVPTKQNINNQILLYNNPNNAFPNISSHNNQINNNTIETHIETNNDLTNSEMKAILTDSEIDRLINNNKILNNTFPNNNQQDGMKELEKIFTKDEINELFPNYVGTTQTIVVNNTNEEDQTINNYDSFSKNSINNTNKTQIKCIDSLVNKNKPKRSRLYLNNIRNNNKKLNNSFFTIDTVTTDVQNNTCLTDRVPRRINKNSKYSKTGKTIIKNNKNNKNNVRLLNKQMLLKQVSANTKTKTNTINTNWENGITQDEVTLFFDNIQNSNALENAKMQIYSLLGEVTPSFGDTDKIRLMFDVIKYNNNNDNEKHIYDYEKSLSITGTFIDYYLKNIELYNSDIERFNMSCIEEATTIIPYDKDDYSCATEIFDCNSFPNIINRVVKGVNLIENFKNNNSESKIVKIIPLKLDKGKTQDWFTSTFQLFDYALQYSSKDDAIRETNFAKFTNYLRNKSKYRNLNEEIQFIPTLKSFVRLNKNSFNTNEVKSALEALYRDENSDIGCYGIMGSILMFRIFPELQTIFSSNQFGLNDSIINVSNKFYFSKNQSFAKQFNNQAHQLLDIAYYDNGRKLFDSTDYLIMITNGFTRNKVINDRKYISRYNTENMMESNQSMSDCGSKLELYELVGVQLYSNKNVNYISIDKSKLEDAINSQTTLGKLCINKKLQPMQALYKRISQDSIV